jgi:hypothetical protein
MVPLYNTNMGLWNWGLPLLYPNGGVAEECIPMPGFEKALTKKYLLHFSMLSLHPWLH